MTDTTRRLPTTPAPPQPRPELRPASTFALLGLLALLGACGAGDGPVDPTVSASPTDATAPPEAAPPTSPERSGESADSAPSALPGTGSGSGPGASAASGTGAPSADPPFEWVQEPLDIPRVQYLTFESALLGGPVGVHVFVPVPHDLDEERRFPVLYWLHGSGGGRGGVRPLALEFATAMQQGLVAPFLVVFLESPPLSLWVDAVDGAPVESLVVQELVPFIDETFRTVAGPEGRWLEGFSMGGFGALRYAFLYPEVFGNVSSLAAGPLSPDLSEAPRIREGEDQALLDDLYGGDIETYIAQHPWALAEGLEPGALDNTVLRLAIGALDNSSPNKVVFHEHLEELGVDHDFFLVPGVGHQTQPLLEGLGEARWTFYPQP